MSISSLSEHPESLLLYEEIAYPADQVSGKREDSETFTETSIHLRHGQEHEIEAVPTWSINRAFPC